jgi:NAD(P)-dependent dehydrogenase (short-subunit alcohol dehydrogenase family)
MAQSFYTSHTFKRPPVPRIRRHMKTRIFITGGASGLGREIALRWAREGARVCIGDVNGDRGADVVREIAQLGGTGRFMQCDVTRMADLDNAAEWLAAHWGGVDVVVNNAGVATSGRIEAEPVEQWEWILNINLLGVVRGCKAFAPMLRAQKAGHVVNIASMAGIVHLPQMGSYNAAKAAVVAFSETLRQEVVDDGIGVSVVCPSFFKTNLTESLRSTDPNSALVMNKLFAKSPITAAEVADRIYDGVKANRFLVLPHRDDVRAYRLKCFAPVSTYLNIVAKVAKRIESMARR